MSEVDGGSKHQETGGDQVTDNNRRTGFMFRSLRHRNFRLFFTGQSISYIGTWMQEIALPWLVYQLTGSVFLLGLIGFTTALPNFVFAPIAGSLVDRWNRHRLLILTQTSSMLLALALALLAFWGIGDIWPIFVLSLGVGLVHSIDMPVRHAFLTDMIDDRRDFGNAIALNSSLYNSSRLIGPTIAGILIVLVGEGVCFLINAVSFIPIIFALLIMKTTSRPRREDGANLWKMFREGFSYVFRFGPIREVIFLLALTSLMGSYSTLLPVFAKDILNGGATELGFLTAAAGGGALIATFYLASKKRSVGLGKTIALAVATFGIGLAVFSMSNVLALSIVIILFVGFGTMIHTTTSTTVLQHITSDEKRGRVMAFFTMAIAGVPTFGSLLAGTLATSIGAPNTLLIGGAACTLGALLFAMRLSTLRKAHVARCRSENISAEDVF